MATTTDAAPPNTMAIAGPNNCPVTPDSNAPNSFDAPISTISTARTWPRIASGVTSGTSVARMYTLIASAADSIASARNATAKLVVTPRATVPTPNAATAIKRITPMWRRTGRIASPMVMIAAPIPVAARSQPRPTAPTPSRSSAMAGNNAIAPPNNTAMRSRVIAPSSTGMAVDEPEALHRFVDLALLGLPRVGSVEGIGSVDDLGGLDRVERLHRPDVEVRAIASTGWVRVRRVAHGVDEDRRAHEQCGNGEERQHRIHRVEHTANHRAEDRGQLPRGRVTHGEPRQVDVGHEVGRHRPHRR